MRAYVAVVSKRGRLGPTLDRDLGGIAARALPFAEGVERTGTWIAPSGRVGLFAWSNEPAREGLAPLLHTSRTAAVGWSGYFSGDGIVPEQLLAGLRSTGDRAGLAARLGGLFALFYADGEQLEVFNCITRIEPVYWCETRRRVYVGTRALLIHMAAKRVATPQYDPARLVPFLNAGFYASEDTPYRDLEILAPGHHLAVSKGRVRHRPNDALLDAAAQAAASRRCCR